MRKPKYRKHTTRDLAFVEFSGKRHYLPGAFKSVESLTAYQEFLKSHGLLFVEAGDKPQRVVAVINRFMDWAESTYPTGTRSEWMNCRSALKHLRRLDGNCLVSEYGPQKLKALQNHLARARKSRNYINAVAARVKRMFKWAAAEGLVSPSIYHGLSVVPGLRRGRSEAVETAPKQPATWEQVSSVKDELSATVWAMCQLQWLTGVRSQSICHARVKQFDQTCQPWEWRPVHKTEGLGHALVVFVGPQAQAVLKPFMRGDYLFQPKHLNGERAKGYKAFYDSVSYMRAISRAQERVNRARAKAGLDPIPRWTPHQIRHAKGTAVRITHGLDAAQATLGHKTLSATQIYAQPQRDLARKVAEEHG
jgi:integrase